MMRVALDLEDVLVESNSAFLKELRSFISENHPESDFEPEVSDIDGWKFEGIREGLAELQNWKDPDVEKFFEGDSNGWRGFHPITEEMWENEPQKYETIPKDIVGSVKQLKAVIERKGGELYLVTARQNVNHAVHRKVEHLGINHFFEDVIFKVSKDELEFDVYIDDYPHLHQKLDSGIHLLVDRPWNENQDVENPHKRVSGIEEATEVIKNLDR